MTLMVYKMPIKYKEEKNSKVHKRKVENHFKIQLNNLSKIRK